MMDFENRDFPGQGNGFGWRRRLQNMATASGMPGFGTLPMQVGGRDWYIGNNDALGNFNRALDAYGHGGAMPSFGTLPLPQFGTGPGSRVKPMPSSGFQAEPQPLSFGTLPLSPTPTLRDRAVSIPRMRGM